MTKGIILAGGFGTRLFPLTKGISKQLLPIFDKPMIYYPISILMLANIRDILVISTLNDIENYKNLLGNGSHIGLNIEYEIQKTPGGLAEAFLIGEKFIGNEKVCLVLGDNIFYGSQFSPLLEKAAAREDRATIFAYHVKNPEEFGVVSFDKNNVAITIEEKPSKPKSEFAITGLYFYDNSVVKLAKNIKPSARNELEISSINQIYLEEKKLHVEILGRGYAWLDTGSSRNLLQASQFIETIQTRQGFYVACLEEIAWRKNWISDEQLHVEGVKLEKTDYGKYLLNLLDTKILN